MPHSEKPRAKALKFDLSHLAQGGLAFLIAYTITYVINAF